MKKIAVILPINNADILRQSDLLPFQSTDYFFELHYVDTYLRELNTADEVGLVSKLTFEKAEQVVSDNAAAVIIYAFGEFGFEKELEEKLSVSVVTLGAKAIQEASHLSQKKFTILPGMLTHNGFLEGFVSGLKLQKNNYQMAKSSPEVSPAQIRSDKNMLGKLTVLASKEIQENNIDTFTLGCGSFIGLAKPLQDILQKEFGSTIHVVDPVLITFNSVNNQLASKKGR